MFMPILSSRISWIHTSFLQPKFIPWWFDVKVGVSPRLDVFVVNNINNHVLKKERSEEMSIELPEMTLDPLYHVTLGMGLPPPDSQTKRSSWPSLKGPMMELEMSLPSANDTLRYLGLAVKKKNYGVVNRRMIWWFDQFQCRDNCVMNDVLVKLLKLWKSASRGGFCW